MDRLRTRFIRADKAAKQRLREEREAKREALELYPVPYISMLSPDYPFGPLEAADTEFMEYVDELILKETR